MNILGVGVNIKEVVILAAIGAGAVYALKTVGAGVIENGVDTAEKIIDSINPTNPENIFAGAVNNVGGSVSGEDDWTVGGALFDLGHNDIGEPNVLGRGLDWLILN